MAIAMIPVRMAIDKTSDNSPAQPEQTKYVFS